MTADPAQGSPPPLGPATDAVFAATGAYTAALIALEDRAAALAAGPLRAGTAAMLRRLTALYARLAGALDLPLPPAALPRLQQEAAADLAALAGLDPSPSISDSAAHAYQEAVSFAQEQAGTVAVDRLPGAQADDALARAVDVVAETVAARIGEAQQAVQTAAALDYQGIVLDTAAKASRAANSAEMAARWSVNRGANAGIRDASAQKGAFLLWAGERTACLHCVAYIGHFVSPGQSFPVGMTWGDRPLIPWPDPAVLDGPPLHPDCRCVLISWFGPAALHPVDTAIYNRPELQGNVDLAAAMRREAKRSVLHGWSLPSESEAARLRGAERLLRAGAGMPKTVEARARKAVRDGRFPDRHRNVKV